MIVIISTILFICTFYTYNIYVATITIGIFNFIIFLLFKIIYKKINLKFLVSSFFLIFFGIISIYFKNDIFIKLKTSFFYWCLFIILILLITNKKLLKKIKINKKYINIIKIDFALLFLIMGFINLYIINNYSTKTWILFKIVFFPIIIFIYIFLKSNKS